VAAAIKAAMLKMAMGFLTMTSGLGSDLAVPQALELRGSVPP